MAGPCSGTDRGVRFEKVWRAQFLDGAGILPPGPQETRVFPCKTQSNLPRALGACLERQSVEDQPARGRGKVRLQQHVHLCGFEAFARCAPWRSAARLAEPVIPVALLFAKVLAGMEVF